MRSFFIEGFLKSTLLELPKKPVDGVAIDMVHHPKALELADTLKLQDIILAMAGARQEPAVGWLNRPTVVFESNGSSWFKMDTCAARLVLRVTADTMKLDRFIFMFTIGLANCGVFSDI